MRSHVLVWNGDSRVGMEVAHVRFEGGRLSARGTQIGVAPEGYRLDYRLETDPRLVTRRLRVELVAAQWSRRLDLRRTRDGRWGASTTTVGDPDLPPPGGDMTVLEPARDCDLAFSPLTNLMPVRRAGLLERPGREDFLMAWVAVPSLQVLPSHQTYEHVARVDGGAVVRYIGRHRGYTGELHFDADGFIRLYPGLAQRLHPEPLAPGPTAGEAI